MHTLTPDEVSAQYNNRALVPDHPRIIGEWLARSKLYRSHTPQALIDVPYGEGPLHTLDVFPASEPARTDAAAAPVLVFIHGGYWRALDKADHSFVAQPFAEKGALVVVPNYTLAPAIGIDGICIEVAQAVLWTWRHASEHGGDPARIVVAGHSAGGHLAA